MPREGETHLVVVDSDFVEEDWQHNTLELILVSNEEEMVGESSGGH